MASCENDDVAPQQVLLNRALSWKQRVAAIANRASLVALLLAALVMLAIRFAWLERSPPGFYVDEWLGALQIACLGQEGRTASGVRWPLFAPGGDGVYTPTFLYFGAAWTRLFGYSIASFRSISAFFNALTVVGTYLLARRLAGSRVAFWVFVCACLSPWSFQFARVAWDPPLAPAFVTLACFFWFGDRAIRDGILSGLFAALAVYSYPPTRMQVPLLMLCLILMGLWAKSVTPPRVLAFLVSMGTACVPLISKMLDSGFNQRAARLVIWSSEFLNGRPDTLSAGTFFIRTLGDNLSTFFRPSFLFFEGDPNRRHSPQFIGELSFLDDFAIILGMLLIAVAVRRLSRESTGTEHETLLPVTAGRYIALALIGGFLGILPAACTHEGLPHSLRAIGAWPFLALLFGGFLAAADKRWDAVRVLAAVLCVGYLVFFLRGYFAEYPRNSSDWFDANIKASLTQSQLDDRSKSQFARQMPEAVRYYAIASGMATCSSSEDLVKQWSAGFVLDPSRP